MVNSLISNKMYIHINKYMKYIKRVWIKLIIKIYNCPGVRHNREGRFLTLNGIHSHHCLPNPMRKWQRRPPILSSDHPWSQRVNQISEKQPSKKSTHVNRANHVQGVQTPSAERKGKVEAPPCPWVKPDKAACRTKAVNSDTCHTEIIATRRAPFCESIAKWISGFSQGRLLKSR